MPITVKDIREAAATLQQYKSAKANLEQKIIDNEQWFKMRHWEQYRRRDGGKLPASAWLFNSILNKHADAMDNYPEPAILPAEESDSETAKMLSQVVPAILERNNYEQVYSDAWWYKLKHGCSAYGVFWNSELENGLGDIQIRKIDLLNIKGKTGDIEVDEGFTFNNVEVNNSTGDIEFKANVNGNLNIKNSTGDIEIENNNIGGNVNVITSTGDIDLTNLKCNKLDIKVSTGDTKLINVLVTEDFNMIGSTGSVKFDGFDANNIFVTVDTGDVKGTILTSKIFIARSKTGSVNVPETLTGGVCKIIASTGSIKISYK